MSVYVILEEKVWQSLALGECTEDGELIAVLDPQTLKPMADGLGRHWSIISPPHPTAWAALAELPHRR